MAEFASKGVAGAALGIGIGGLANSILNSVGGLSGLFGNRTAAPADPGDRPVTRYELGLVQEINGLRDENIKLKADMYADKKAAELQGEISQQLAFNATAVATLGNLQQQITALQGITKVVVPSSDVMTATVGTATAASGG